MKNSRSSSTDSIIVSCYISPLTTSSCEKYVCYAALFKNAKHYSKSLPSPKERLAVQFFLTKALFFYDKNFIIIFI